RRLEVAVRCCIAKHQRSTKCAECGGSSRAAAARLIVVAFKGPRALLAQGTPLHVASEILGHASITITKAVYGHLVEGDRRAAAASHEPGGAAGGGEYAQHWLGPGPGLVAVVLWGVPVCGGPGRGRPGP